MTEPALADPSTRRSGRRARVEEAVMVSPIPPGLVGGRYKPLTDAEVLRIHELTLQLLEDLGLSQLTPSLEARAVAAGCRVDGNGRMRFPRALVEDVIARSHPKPGYDTSTIPVAPACRGRRRPGPRLPSGLGSRAFYTVRMFTPHGNLNS